MFIVQQMLNDMFSYIVNSISDYMINDFNAFDVIVAVISYIVILMLKKFIERIKSAYYCRTEFNITGFWICTFDSYMHLGRKVVEIYYINQKSSELNVKILSFNDEYNKPSKLRGTGKIRNSFVSFFYYSKDRKSSVLGVSWLNIKQIDVEKIALVGNCYEDFSNQSKKEKNRILNYQRDNDILVLRRIRVPLIKKILFKIGLNPFCSYKKAFDLVKNIL